MAGRLPSGGLECVIAAESSLSFPVGGRTFCRVGRFNQMLIGVATRKYARSVRMAPGFAGHWSVASPSGQPSTAPTAA